MSGEFRFTTNVRWTQQQVNLIDTAKESDRHFADVQASIDKMEDGDAKVRRAARELPFIMSHALSHAFEAVGIFAPTSSYATNAKSATRKKEAVAWRLVKEYLKNAQPSSGTSTSSDIAVHDAAVAAAWTQRKAQKTRRDNKAASTASRQQTVAAPRVWQRELGERLARK